MPAADERRTTVKAKAVIVDATSMTVVWTNDADWQPGAATVDEAVPMAEVFGVAEALGAAAETGVPQHLRTPLVSTSRGAVEIVVSIYPLPDARLLVLSEQAWQAGRKSSDEGSARRSSRRGR